MANPLLQKTRQRKMIYFGAIVVLFTLSLLAPRICRHAASVRLATREDARGEVELTSPAVCLVLTGSRGVAVTMLWYNAMDMQNATNGTNSSSSSSRSPSYNHTSSRRGCFKAGTSLSTSPSNAIARATNITTSAAAWNCCPKGSGATAASRRPSPVPSMLLSRAIPKCAITWASSINSRSATATNGSPSARCWN